MKKIVVVAPHPDDETLGCGGTLLRLKDEGNEIHWLIMTEMSEESGFTKERIRIRNEELKKVAEMYCFKDVHHLKFPALKLDTIPRNIIINAVHRVMDQISPDIGYLPSPTDIHSDHRIAFSAVTACLKWFRLPTIKRVLSYETLSVTDLSFHSPAKSFFPNVYVNISETLEKKIEIMKLYENEISDFPFPRSSQAIRALAQMRGASSGFHAAEAFMLLKEFV